MQRQHPIGGTGRLAKSAKCALRNRFVPNSAAAEYGKTFSSKVFCSRFSPDGSLLGTANMDGIVRFYDTGQYLSLPLR